MRNQSNVRVWLVVLVTLIDTREKRTPEFAVVVALENKPASRYVPDVSVALK